MSGCLSFIVFRRPIAEIGIAAYVRHAIQNVDIEDGYERSKIRKANLDRLPSIKLVVCANRSGEGVRCLRVARAVRSARSDDIREPATELDRAATGPSRSLYAMASLAGTLVFG